METTEKEYSPWYSEESGFYTDWYFKIYDIPSKDERTPFECDFLEKVLRLEKGSKILDLCCGHGRITNELAARGYDMTGQDINRFFLKLAEKNSPPNASNVHYIHGDMREIPFENKFDAVLNMYTSIGVFGSDDEDERVFKAANSALKTGGKFVLDYINKDFIIRRYTKEDTKEIEGGYVKIRRVYDHLKSSHKDYFDIYVGGKLVKQFENEFRFYSVTELTAMLNRAGFRILDVYGNFDLTPLSFDSRGCIIISEKV